jgi:hypothetical protein
MRVHSPANRPAGPCTIDNAAIRLLWLERKRVELPSAFVITRLRFIRPGLFGSNIASFRGLIGAPVCPSGVCTLLSSWPVVLTNRDRRRGGRRSAERREVLGQSKTSRGAIVLERGL